LPRCRQSVGAALYRTSSKRFADHPNDQQWVMVVVASQVCAGKTLLLGCSPAGTFARELTTTPVHETLIVTNLRSVAVEFLDLRAVPLAPPDNA
jgi:hypothetical protein